MTDATQDSSPTRLEPVAGEWQRVSPKYIVVDLVGTLIGGAVLTVGTGLPWFFSQLPFLLAIPITVGVISLLIVVFTPRRVRSIGYQLREDDLLFRRGLMFQRFVAVGEHDHAGAVEQVGVERLAHKNEIPICLIIRAGKDKESCDEQHVSDGRRRRDPPREDHPADTQQVEPQ